jgi:S1-C subfamily serine protease
MNAIRKSLLVACVAAATMPVLCAAAEPAPPAPPRPADPQQREMDRRLEEARARLEQAAGEVARLSGELGRRYAYQLQLPGGAQPRALLGISVDTREQNKGGAVVGDVSPGGAAAEAGIKSGDVVTNIGGKDLTTEPDPGRALVDAMRQAEPNLKMQVDVLRDGKKLSFDVTPRPAPQPFSLQLGQLNPPGNGVDGNFYLRQQAPGARGAPGGPGAQGERRIEIRTLRDGPDDGTRFRGLEFATLSEKLGSYFGVKAGVLVVRAGPNPAFKLQDGDVILAIDGREPTSAQHAARILRSYSDGEKFMLRVQRDRKAQNIEVTMPAGGPDDVAH